jgi:endonuclease/exonuclease/phosphatase family metal-dependent hydrolase
LHKDEEASVIHYKQEEMLRAVKALQTMPHRAALEKYIPGLLEPDEDSGIARAPASCGAFSAAVFNMEAGRRFKEIQAYLRCHPLLKGLDVIFANELDWGMARTGNLHITRELALSLNMNYAYGVEFLSVRTGESGSGLGLHGNAILSKFPLSRIKIVRLPEEYDWFHYKENDSRLGLRMAVLADADLGGGVKAGLVSVHLENRTTPEGRKRQMEFLLDELESHYPADMPILMGGDMNTNTVDGGDDSQMQCLSDDPDEQWRRIGQIPSWEPLMDCAASRGLGYGDCNIAAKPTRRKPMEDGRTLILNLDWFFQRGFSCSDPVRVESIFHPNGFGDAPEEVLSYQGRELSDHDIVMIRCGREK